MGFERTVPFGDPQKLLAIFLGITVLAYIGLLLLFAPLLLQDYPNHLARATVIADLLNHNGSEFGQEFSFHFLAVPYVAADLGLVSLMDLLGARFAAAVWPVIAFLALPCGLYAYLRMRGTSNRPLLFMLLLSIYLSTDTTFMMGFLSYRVGVGLVFFALALAEPLHKQWSPSGFIAFMAVIVLTYLTHFAAFVFVIAALGVSAVTRLTLQSAPLRREVILFVPLIGVAVWHAVVENRLFPAQASTDPYMWGSVTLKFEHLLWDMFRYGSGSAFLMSAAFAVAILVWSRGAWRRGALLDVRVLEPLLLTAAFLAIYVVLPGSYSAAGYVDVRTLVFPPIYAMVAVCSLREIAPGTERTARQFVLAVALAGLLAIVNLAYLARHLHNDGEQITAYRKIVAAIPPHSPVLPIYTGPGEGVMKPFLHAAEYAVIDRHALVPYLFSANRGEPMTYFRYLQLPYAPSEDWYSSHVQMDPDWNKVREQYRYLLLRKPFDPSRLHVKTTLVAENSAAALLEIRSTASMTRPPSLR